MRRIILLTAVAASFVAIAGPAFGTLFKWRDRVRPPVSLNEALDIGERLLGDDAKNRFCVDVSIYGNPMGAPKPGAWNLLFAADFEVAHGLYSNGWAMMLDTTGKQCFPIWPECEFAELLATGDWESYVAKPISLEQLRNKWIPGLTRDHINIAAFPTSEQVGVVLTAHKFGTDLAYEIAQYE